MELLIVVAALFLLGLLANRYGHDSRDRSSSDEERLSAQGFAWDSQAGPHAAAPRVPARPTALALLSRMLYRGWRHHWKGARLMKTPVLEHGTALVAAWLPRRGSLPRLLAVVGLVLSGGTACAALGNAPAAPNGPIRIGMVVSLTGNYAALGTNQKLGAQQVVDNLNANNGINGRKIELDIVDDSSDPNQTVVQFNKVISDGVVAVLGPSGSTAGLAIKPIANAKQIPTISLATADEQVVPVTPYMWMTPPLASHVANVCVEFAASQGKTKLAMLYDAGNAFALAGHEAAMKALATSGMQLVDDQAFETKQTNFAPQLAKITEARPDVLLVLAVGAPAVVITKAWADLNTGIPLMMSAAQASTLYVQPSGAAAEGVFVEATMGVVGESLPTSNKFKKLMDELATPFKQVNNYYPPQFAWDGMVATSLLIDAIMRKGASSDQIRDGLDSISLDTPQGHYTFTPQKHWGMPDSGNVMSVIKDGRFVPAPGVTQEQLAAAGQ
jgi:branched-chain amino acid transport system substrate-binding protein